MKMVVICTYLAARRCFNAGHSVKEIAASAKVSPSTVRRWLRCTGLTSTRRQL